MTFVGAESGPSNMHYVKQAGMSLLAALPFVYAVDSLVPGGIGDPNWSAAAELPVEKQVALWSSAAVAGVLAILAGRSLVPAAGHRGGPAL